MSKPIEYIDKGKERVKRRSDLGKQELKARTKRTVLRVLEGRKKRGRR